MCFTMIAITTVIIIIITMIISSSSISIIVYSVVSYNIISRAHGLGKPRWMLSSGLFVVMFVVVLFNVYRLIMCLLVVIFVSRMLASTRFPRVRIFIRVVS